MSLLQPCDAFAIDRPHPSRPCGKWGDDLDSPEITIAIPTFRRFDTLVEALGSALTQDTSTKYEIIIVDNGPELGKPERLVAASHAHLGRPLRYYENSCNIGMFGNWNRCIELARAPWVTILNDDDLLLPNFIESVSDVIRRHPEVDGIVCRQSWRDRRNPPLQPQRANRPSLVKRLSGKMLGALHDWRFRRGFHQIRPRRLFFGNDLGNGAGFLFRKRAALELGGYDPDDWPVADFFFLIRMSISHNLYQLRETLAEVGIGDNESMERETLIGFITRLHEARTFLAGRHVPRRWLGLAPQLAANHLAVVQQAWDETITSREVEARLGFAIPPPSPRWEKIQRVIHGAI